MDLILLVFWFRWKMLVFWVMTQAVKMKMPGWNTSECRVNLLDLGDLTEIYWFVMQQVTGWTVTPSGGICREAPCLEVVEVDHQYGYMLCEAWADADLQVMPSASHKGQSQYCASWGSFDSIMFQEASWLCFISLQLPAFIRNEGDLKLKYYAFLLSTGKLCDLTLHYILFEEGVKKTCYLGWFKLEL